MDEEKLLLWRQRMTQCKESGLPVKTWCKQNGVSNPAYYYWKKRIAQIDTLCKTKPIVPTFVEVLSKEQLQEHKHPTALHIEWNQMHFDITTKEDAALAAYFIRQLQTLC